MPDVKYINIISSAFVSSGLSARVYTSGNFTYSLLKQLHPSLSPFVITRILTPHLSAADSASPITLPVAVQIIAETPAELNL